MLHLYFTTSKTFPISISCRHVTVVWCVTELAISVNYLRFKLIIIHLFYSGGISGIWTHVFKRSNVDKFISLQLVIFYFRHGQSASLQLYFAACRHYYHVKKTPLSNFLSIFTQDWHQKWQNKTKNGLKNFCSADILDLQENAALFKIFGKKFNIVYDNIVHRKR